MIEDNTPTVTARRRKPTELMRIRLETARRLQGLNARTKAKRAASKAKRDKEARKLLEEAGSHAFEIAPRVPKIKKNKLSHPPPPESRFQKRQRAKTWLPTHMFHAKRARMTPSKDPLWRFALPVSPTEKSYRPSHRARGARGAVAWDMSYMSTIQLEGTEAALESVLRAVGVDGEEAWGAKGRKWRAGTRSLQAWVFEKENKDGRRRPIAPVTLIWRARSKSEDVEMVDADSPSAQQKKKKKDRERLFIRVHPSAFLQLWNDLLEVSKRQNPPVMVEDLRFEIGSIEITGPGSTEALIAVLQPLMGDGKEPPATDSPEATWSSLLGVTNPLSLPQNALLAFSISDPRLHFPPKRLSVPTSDMHMNSLAVLLSSWPPDRTQTLPALFDRPARLAAIRSLPSQKAINRRRTLAGPGKYPPRQPTDPKIPVMLLTSSPRIRSKKNNTNNNNLPGTWTVLLPWKCVLPVWYSLMYYPLSSGGNPRFGGLKEQQQLEFEAGEPWFPGDFPGTRAGWEWNLRERDEAKKEWERRPKGRRVEFDSLDLGSGRKGEIGRGWACDWERLIQGENEEKDPSTSDYNDKDGKPDGEDADDAIQIPPLNIHHLTPPTAESLLNSIPSSLASMNKSTLATIKITLLNRGTPTPRARIYRLPTTNPELYQKWLDLAPSPQNQKEKQNKNQNRKQSTGESIRDLCREGTRQRLAASLISSPVSDKDKDKDESVNSLHLPIPSEGDLIGFVTSGNYNLSEGKGTGIGSIVLGRIFPSSGETGKGGNNKKNNVVTRERRLCIVRGSGERVGRLGIWDIV